MLTVFLKYSAKLLNAVFVIMKKEESGATFEEWLVF